MAAGYMTAGVVGGVCSPPCPCGECDGVWPLPEAVMSTTCGGVFRIGVVSPVGGATGVVEEPAGISPAVVVAGDGSVAGVVEADSLPLKLPLLWLILCALPRRTALLSHVMIA